MGKHLLVPFDESSGSDAALAYVCEEFPDARVTLLHAIDTARATVMARPALFTVSNRWYERRRAAAEALLEDARERAPETMTVETAIETGLPSRIIVKFATDHDLDGIVMGSHGREGVVRVLRGSVAEVVIRRSPVPVTVVQ